VRIVARVADPDFRARVDRRGGRLKAELIHDGGDGAAGPAGTPERRPGIDGGRPHRGDAGRPVAGPGGSEEAERLGAALLVACHSMEDCTARSLTERARLVAPPGGRHEIEARLSSARQRSIREALQRNRRDAAELLRYEELLHDRLTGFPTLPVMMEQARDLLEGRGELTILYIQFVWYEKIEEIYGWQKLDDVLESTASGVSEFYRRHHPESKNLMMVSHIGDDDFILITERPQGDAEQPEKALKELTQDLESFLRERLERTTRRTSRRCAGSTWARPRCSGTRRSGWSGSSTAGSGRRRRRRVGRRTGSGAARSPT
jgi:GGDEF domain-containing protein